MKHTWALENKKVNSDSPGDSDLFGNTLYIREKAGLPGQRRLHTEPGRYQTDLQPKRQRPHHLTIHLIGCPEGPGNSAPGPLSRFDRTLNLTLFPDARSQSCPRMRFVVDFQHPSRANMGIFLGRGQLLMT